MLYIKEDDGWDYKGFYYHQQTHGPGENLIDFFEMVDFPEHGLMIVPRVVESIGILQHLACEGRIMIDVVSGNGVDQIRHGRDILRCDYNKKPIVDKLGSSLLGLIRLYNMHSIHT